MNKPSEATENFASLADMVDHSRQILEQVQRTKKPLVVTVDGKPELVVLDAATYEYELHVRNLGQMLSEAEQSVREGKVRPAGEVLEELMGDETIRSRGQRRRRA